MFRSLASLLAVAITVPLMAAKCGYANPSGESGGEVISDSLRAYQAVDYPLTSDNYNKWIRAENALDSVNVDATVRRSARELTDEDIDDLVESLEKQPSARAAIESSGLSVRNYVLTTIALAQSWDAVNSTTVRFTGMPPENVEFLRRQAAEDPAVRARPRARFLEGDADSDSEDSDNRKKKKRRGGKDSDSDS